MDRSVAHGEQRERASETMDMVRVAMKLDYREEMARLAAVAAGATN